MSIIVSSATEAPAIIIRDIERVPEMREVETLQKDVWGSNDLDVVPLTMLVASREVGAVLVGAYDESMLVGFVYGFPAYENGQVTHHSHMLAVRPSYRNHNLAYKLKLAQRERVLAQSIKRITWTFDPLQSLNAYFNFGKLGVLADTYKINFYGEATSSFLHQIGTDRLWVTWLLDGERVRQRLQTEKKESMLYLNGFHLWSKLLLTVHPAETSHQESWARNISRSRFRLKSTRCKIRNRHWRWNGVKRRAGLSWKPSLPDIWLKSSVVRPGKVNRSESICSIIEKNFEDVA